MNLVPFRTKRATGLEPFASSSLADFRSDMNRLFEGLFGRMPLGTTWYETPEAMEWIPAVDLTETDTGIQVRAELPGIDPENVDVSVSEDRLMISGEKKSATTASGNGFKHREIRFGAFSRTISLPDPVDPANVSARYDKGILTVDLAKSPSCTSRKVPVQVK